MAQKKKTESNSPASSVNAVVRVFTILETLSRYKIINLEHLARETKLAKPTVYRFLNTLRELGYVRRDKNDQYFATLKMFSVGSRALDHMDLYLITHPIAEELSECLGETVHIGVREDFEATYIVKIESKYTIRMYSQVGKKIPLYCTAIGKALLSEESPETLGEYLETTRLVPFTPCTITSKKAFFEELARVRETGVAEDREEHETGIRCIGSPIRDYSGRITAALSVSWPMFRFDPARTDEYRQAVVRAAREISAVLGGIEAAR